MHREQTVLVNGLDFKLIKHSRDEWDAVVVEPNINHWTLTLNDVWVFHRQENNRADQKA